MTPDAESSQVLDLAGKVAVVTGGASGLGRAFAMRFAAEGMRVVLADIETQALEATGEQLRGAGYQIESAVVDVSDAGAMMKLAERVQQELGPVHVLCNNAGVDGYLGPISEATAADWQWTFGVNFWGVVNGVNAFLPAMLEQREIAYIVNTASAAGLTPARSIYGVTKHAVVAFSEAVHTEMERRGSNIQVSVLCPGTVNTNLFSGSRNRPAPLRNPGDSEDAPEFRAQVREQMLRSPDPSEIAELLLEAIAAGKFYITTDEETPRLVQRRFDAIAGGRPPTRRQ